MKTKGGRLWLIFMLLLAVAGCAVGQRTVVVRPEEVAKQNDPDWKITKQPQRAQQSGRR